MPLMIIKAIRLEDTDWENCKSCIQLHPETRAQIVIIVISELIIIFVIMLSLPLVIIIITELIIIIVIIDIIITVVIINIMVMKRTVHFQITTSIQRIVV